MRGWVVLHDVARHVLGAALALRRELERIRAFAQHLVSSGQTVYTALTKRTRLGFVTKCKVTKEKITK